MAREPSGRCSSAPHPSHPSPRPVRAPLLAALLALAATTCFTGDGLADQPCNSDEDCNTLVDLYGQHFSCQHHVCNYVTKCGDGIVDSPTEECDHGEENVTQEYGTRSGDCSASTCLLLPWCGDGVTNAPYEECDDGNSDNADACASTCKLPGCGDAIVAGEEECDDGNEDNTDACLNSCQAARCGDSLTQSGVEECDRPNDPDTCTSDCKHAGCGNGHKEGGESCDDGNNVSGDGCSATCAFENCGDGKVDPQEQCEDENDDNTDDCVNCLNAVCGDGVTWAKHEECDDGDNSDTSSCPNCQLAKCGDKLVHEGVEECDDGNDNNNDECVESCQKPKCGDGYLWAGHEECDDGNTSDEDACLSSCVPNTCGDGIVDKTTEGCDDQNTDNNDGCSNDCQMGATAIGSGQGAIHTCVVRSGKVRCWGGNAYGQLGSGDTASLGDEPGELPGAEVNVGGFVVKIAANARTTCALLNTGQVRSWGQNTSGVLGIGNLNFLEVVGDEPKEMPPKPALVGEVVADIDAGRAHMCALLVTGAVRCWGGNSLGQLGQPMHPDGEPPEKVGDVQIGGLAEQIDAGADHTCALLVGGKVRCWGSNSSGRLGYPGWDNVGDDEHPSMMPPVDIGGIAVQIAAGGAHTCALLDSGGLRCWGQGQYGALGYQSPSNIGDNEYPNSAGDVKMLDPGDKVTKIALGNIHTCALLDGGSVRCWGYGKYLGYGSEKNIGLDESTPATVDLADTAHDLALSTVHSCALLEGGRVRCWGQNQYGQLAQGHTEDIGNEPNEMPPKEALLYPNPKP